MNGLEKNKQQFAYIFESLKESDKIIKERKDNKLDGISTSRLFAARLKNIKEEMLNSD